MSANALREESRVVAAVAKVSSGSHLAALDLARGLAAVAVVIFHFATNGWLPVEHWLARVSWFGHLGVRAFFVISGFVVPLAMWRGGYGAGAFVPFLSRRMARLYPPYLASVVIMAVSYTLCGHPPALSALAAHTLYLNDALGLPWLIDVYWTLAIEVQFYLAIALLWRAAVDRGAWLFPAAAGAALALTFLPFPERTLPHFGAYFVLGIAAFRAHAGLGRQAANLAVLVASVLAIAYTHRMVSAVAAVLPLALLAVKWNLPRWAARLGEVSYSLYLFHLATGGLLLALLQHLPLAAPVRAVLVFVALAVSLGAAGLAHRLFEVPAIAWAKRFSYRPRA